MTQTHQPLYHADLRQWLDKHPRCSSEAKQSLGRLLEGRDQEIAQMKPEEVFLKHPQHMKALIEAGFSFTTLTVPCHVLGKSQTKIPLDVRVWALHHNARDTVHALLDVQGIPAPTEDKAKTHLSDALRDDQLHNVRYLHRVHPELAAQWAQEPRTLAMLGVNNWFKRPTLRHDTLLIELIIWGLPVEALRQEVQGQAPEQGPHFERVIAKARSKMILADAGHAPRLKTKAPRF